jgi:hypothetical protein
VFDDARVARAPALFAALFEGGDAATAARARRSAAGSFYPDSVMLRCTEASLAAEYDILARGDSAGAASLSRMIAGRLTSAPDTVVAECSIAALTLRSQLAMRGDASALRAVTIRLDSALRAAPASPLLTLMTGNVVAVHAFEQLGDTARALAAARRRPILYGPLQGWTAMLREEARLAAVTGDRAGAVRAYRLFVALRGTAEAPLLREVQRAREEMARLAREARPPS